MPAKPTLLIDFDGVIHDYLGWDKSGKQLGPPIGGSRAAMCLLEKKYRLVLFTSRTNFEELSRWLRHYGFPDMKVTNKKEPAHLIIDDRALCFQGAWSNEFVQRITSFSPHWQLRDVEPRLDTQCPSGSEQPVPEAHVPSPPK